jgi:hypothetical protein
MRKRERENWRIRKRVSERRERQRKRIRGKFQKKRKGRIDKGILKENNGRDR